MDDMDVASCLQHLKPIIHSITGIPGFIDQHSFVTGSPRRVPAVCIEVPPVLIKGHTLLPPLH